MNAFEQDLKYFPTQIQYWQYLDKYSRYNYDLSRRETWVETIDRVVNFFHDLAGDRLTAEEYNEIREGILNMEVMPSMRLLAMAGRAGHRNNITLYNCAFLGVDDIAAFGEALLISMNGCGVGFSVEDKFISKLPDLPKTLEHDPLTLFIVPDNTEGWQAAINYQIESLFSGRIIKFDCSNLRPAGAILRTKGGRASGPEPLINTLRFMEETFSSYYDHGSLLHGYPKLRAIDVHDLMCSIGNAAVSGGVRRTAMISLFDMDDQSMRQAKKVELKNHRYNANNSAVWDSEITPQQFLSHMGEMFAEDNGEPAIFNRHDLSQNLPDRRDKSHIFGTNPCAEIILRSQQFCNLSAAIARKDDTYASLERKVKLAALIGTVQSTATNFPGLRKKWEENCKEERLLGVDITGQRDCPLFADGKENRPDVLVKLRDAAVRTNSAYAKILGINESAAVTCNKPSGNTSVLVDCASGIHARPFPYYLRTVVIDSHSPVCKAMQDSNVPMRPYRNDTFLVSFPIKSPEGAAVESDQTAEDQLRFWAINKLCYTEHNPSVTIKYRPEEILKIVQWIWKNKKIVGGITFMPIVEGNYDYLPIQQITKEEYEAALKKFPQIDFSRIPLYEHEDMTKAAQELACFAGACELV